MAVVPSAEDDPPLLLLQPARRARDANPPTIYGTDLRIFIESSFLARESAVN
jgi:hypothetical protein